MADEGQGRTEGGGLGLTEEGEGETEFEEPGRCFCVCVFFEGENRGGRVLDILIVKTLYPY